jgi:predicted protein tyrosine phosphatase
MIQSRASDATFIHACPLSRLHDVAAGLGRFDLLSLSSPGHGSLDSRDLGCRRQLNLSFNDIAERRAGLVAPDADLVQAIIDFGRAAQEYPMLINCWAGISRSSAAAYVIVCERNPGFERQIADELRRLAPAVTPNRLVVSIADDLLARGGRMTDAIARIGRGADAFEGTPYRLPLKWPIE